MAFEKLYDEFQELKTEHEELKTIIREKLNQSVEHATTKIKEEYLDAKDVIKMLGICAKTLWSMEKAGSIIPIRINKRRKKYSKLKIIEFMRTGITVNALKGYSLE